MSNIEGDHIVTRIPSSTYTLKWSVDKFSKLISGKTVKSLEFHPISGSNWYSELVKSSSGVQWKIYNNSKQDILVHHDISVKDFNGKSLFEKSLQKEYTQSNYSCILIDHSDETSLNNSEYVITFVCSMTLTGHEIKSEITELLPGIHDSVYSLKKLSDDLKTMYEDLMYSDVTLKVDSDIIRAHKTLLRARSPVFAKMFEHELKEKETNEIYITDLESNVLKHLISFLYTGVIVDESFDSVLSLYYAADKYDVSDLRQRCSKILMAKITVENACQVLSWADRHGDASFKKSAMVFVEIHLEPIFATEGWKEFVKSESSLIAEVTEGYTKRRNRQKEAQIDSTQCMPRVLQKPLVSATRCNTNYEKRNNRYSRRYNHSNIFQVICDVQCASSEDVDKAVKAAKTSDDTQIHVYRDAESDWDAPTDWSFAPARTQQPLDPAVSNWSEHPWG